VVVVAVAVVGLVVAEVVVVVELVVVVSGVEKRSLVAYMVTLAAVAGVLVGLECLRRRQDHKAHAVAAAVVAEHVDPADILPTLAQLSECNYLIVSFHMWEQGQKLCPLRPLQHWQQPQMTVNDLAEAADVKSEKSVWAWSLRFRLTYELRRLTQYCTKAVEVGQAMVMWAGLSRTSTCSDRLDLVEVGIVAESAAEVSPAEVSVMFGQSYLRWSSRMPIGLVLSA
jgi:hypothetical protein